MDLDRLLAIQDKAATYQLELSLPSGGGANTSRIVDLNETTKDWMTGFTANSIAYDGESGSDKLFILRCMLICLVDPLARQIQHDSKMKEMLLRLSIMSCRHCATDPYPSDEQIDQLERDVAGFVVYNHLSKDLSGEIPSALAADKIRLCRTQDKGASGLLFTELPERLVSRASRLFYTLNLERDLFNQYQIMPEVRFTHREIHRVNEWLIGRVRIEPSDTVVRAFNASYIDGCIPAGARLEKFRKLKSVNDTPPALSIIEQELGVFQASEISDYADKAKWSDVCKDPSDPLYETLLLTFFDSTMQQSALFRFRDQYFVPASELYKRHHGFGEPRWKYRPRLPLITRFRGSWMVQTIAQSPSRNYRDKVTTFGGWFIHRTLTEALLNWVKLVCDRFGGFLDNGTTQLCKWCVDWLDKDAECISASS